MAVVVILPILSYPVHLGQAVDRKDALSSPRRIGMRHAHTPARVLSMTPRFNSRALRSALTIAAFVAPSVAGAQGQYDTTAFAALRWREVGPYRGGRSVAA